MSTKGPGLDTMLRTAQRGVAAGLAQAEKAAKDIARTSTSDTEDTVEISEDAQKLAQGAEQRTDLAKSLADLRKARQAVLANLATMRTADELAEEALKIGNK